jgi:hypothetical protein
VAQVVATVQLAQFSTAHAVQVVPINPYPELQVAEAFKVLSQVF